MANTEDLQVLMQNRWPDDNQPPAQTLASAKGQAASHSGPTFPGYEILEELGRGGMGVVYRARQLSLNRQVALKVILGGAHAGPQELARFRTEAAAVGRLQHPNIVQIFDVGEHNSLPFLALELVSGPRLDKVSRRNLLTPRQAAALVETLARTMHHVHLHGIVHRDLKPANVLLGEQSPVAGGELFSTPKIVDFGLAKLLNNDQAQHFTHAPVGTPNYMAPEQATMGQAVGPLADVYALGAILYELLTTRPPFEGKTVIDVLEKVRSQDPVPPRRFTWNIVPDLETICLKCLRKEPGQRYANALEIAEDLRRFLQNEPIRARPTGVLERAIRWTRRRPALAGLLGVSALSVVVLFLVNLQHGHDLSATQDQTRAATQREYLVQLQDARKMYHSFAQYQGDALFHWTFATLFPGGDAQVHLDATQLAVQKALEIVNAKAGQQSAPLLHPLWNDREKAEVLSGCYQLHLVLADATASYAPEQPGQGRRDRLLEAIAILDRMAQVFPSTQAYHLHRARYLLHLGDNAAAQRELDRAALVPPASFLDYLLLADERFQQGQVQAAALCFSKALLLEPNDFWSQYFLAVCKLKLQEPAEAEAGLTKCLSLRPDFLWARLLRGFACGELNEFAAAEADFRAVLQADPAVDAKYVTLAARGLVRFRQNKFEPAIADLQDAIALKPDQFSARVSLARIFQVTGDLEKSNQQLETALDLGPSAFIAAECQTERSRNLHQAHHYEHALKAADAALELWPNCAEAAQRRALTLLELKRFEEALLCFDLFLAKGGKAGADFWRARGQTRMQLGDFRAAAEDYSRALEGGADAELYIHRGWAYGFAGAWKLALPDFEAGLRLSPQAADAFTGRGLARVMEGNFREAVQDAEEALRLKPQAPEMMHNIACTFALAAASADRAKGAVANPSLAAAYRERALQAVRQTLDLLPLTDRPRFWRTNILPDKALDSIRNCKDFKLLVQQFAGKAFKIQSLFSQRRFLNYSTLLGLQPWKGSPHFSLPSA